MSKKESESKGALELVGDELTGYLCTRNYEDKEKLLGMLDHYVELKIKEILKEKLKK